MLDVLSRGVSVSPATPFHAALLVRDETALAPQADVMLSFLLRGGNVTRETRAGRVRVAPLAGVAFNGLACSVVASDAASRSRPVFAATPGPLSPLRDLVTLRRAAYSAL